MQIERLAIDGILIVVPAKRSDHRGFFSETYRYDLLAADGVQTNFVQDNHVLSAVRGVLRGMHFQTPPHAQGKLVRCIKGSILDVAVDIRKGTSFSFRSTPPLRERVPPGKKREWYPRSMRTHEYVFRTSL